MPEHSNSVDRPLSISEEQLPDNVRFDNQHPSLSDSRTELLAGLTGQPKRTNPKFFYDETGSYLFEQITQLPEYYLTRCETEILRKRAKEIARCCGDESILVEPGCGNISKARLLLDSIKPLAYVPVDISAEMLLQESARLGRDYPWLNVFAVCADFGSGCHLPDELPNGKPVVFYPGSTIGNMEPEAGMRFLSNLKQWVGANTDVLIGVDLHKSEEIINAAYNDSRGVTAEFNLNVLNRINNLLVAEFDQNHFAHAAYYDTHTRRLEMHLVSRKAQKIRMNGTTVQFAKGETIHTENSYKYSTEEFRNLASQAGYSVKQMWTDDKGLFSVYYLQAK